MIQDYPQSVPVKLLIEQGELHQTILKTIEENNIDLVVMGTKGAASLRELLIGSNTEKIVRTAPVPVFTIHQAMPVSRIKDIIFPTSLDLKQSVLIGKLKTLPGNFRGNGTFAFYSDF
ncbi:universal stress protein [Dyadobacter sp. NIV53]|uniref:universal stress protein n=1 Tax=Dyadobacter sp. NIV53 TaxID=2861765 RepID=UPI001C87BFA9|nr:universal stress protein [Dyadobacter sp. NIV53]